MRQPLAIYLHDHLAGATYALDLVEALRQNYSGTDVGDFAARLQREISADKQVLHEIASRFGSASDPIKDMAAWLGEKVSRMKLSHTDPNGLGTFEALEFLRLGIHGKAGLWLALAEVAPQYPALSEVNFRQLSERARIQEEEIELYRLQIARQALAVQNNSSGLRSKTDFYVDATHRGSAMASLETRARGVTDAVGHDFENPT